VARHPDGPVRSARILAPDTIVEHDARGRLRARSPHPLGPYPGRFTDRLVHWAEHAPDRTFLAVRDAGGAWRELTYRAALDNARRIAQALGVFGAFVDRAAVGPLALEHAACVVQAMGEHADLRLRCGQELAVEPDQVRALVEWHRHGISSRITNKCVNKPRKPM